MPHELVNPPKETDALVYGQVTKPQKWRKNGGVHEVLRHPMLGRFSLLAG